MTTFISTVLASLFLGASVQAHDPKRSYDGNRDLQRLQIELINNVTCEKRGVEIPSMVENDGGMVLVKKKSIWIFMKP